MEIAFGIVAVLGALAAIYGAVLSTLNFIRDRRREARDRDNLGVRLVWSRAPGAAQARLYCYVVNQGKAPIRAERLWARDPLDPGLPDELFPETYMIDLPKRLRTGDATHFMVEDLRLLRYRTVVVIDSGGREWVVSEENLAHARQILPTALAEKIE